MNIALDYDGTFNRDPEFWEKFIDLCDDNDVTVTIVTHRHPELDKISCRAKDLCGIIYTDGMAKRDLCESMGIKFDIWIDDQPIGIERNSDWLPDSEELKTWRANGRVT